MRTKSGHHNHPARARREVLKKKSEHKSISDPSEFFVKKAIGLLDPSPMRRYERIIPEPKFRRDPVPRRNWRTIYKPPRPNIDGVEAAVDKLIYLDKVEWARFLPLQTLSYKLIECFVIKRDSTKFHQLASRLKVPNIQKVYHGTRGTSIVGITNTGLCQGRSGMFGGGIYLAPNIEKAIAFGQYVISCKVILGNQKEVESSEHVDGEQLWAEGYQSVWGMRDKTESWGGKLRWDEYVVYFRDQVLPLAIGRYEFVPPIKI